MTGDTGNLKSLLGVVAGGRALDAAEAERAFDIIMSGDATPAQMGGFLMALRVRGETVAEITGAARAMRAKMLTIEAPEGAVDTCGTGGDATGTYNLSTRSALVRAGCGRPVLPANAVRHQAESVKHLSDSSFDGNLAITDLVAPSSAVRGEVVGRPGEFA